MSPRPVLVVFEPLESQYAALHAALAPRFRLVWAPSVGAALQQAFTWRRSLAAVLVDCRGDELGARVVLEQCAQAAQPAIALCAEGQGATALAQGAAVAITDVKELRDWASVVATAREADAAPQPKPRAPATSHPAPTFP